MDDLILDDDLLENQRSLDDVEFAGFWPRLGAALIDSLVLLPVYGLTFYNYLQMKSFSLMLLLSALSFLYKPYLEWQRSATFGKMALKLKVVDETTLGPISMEQAFKRYFPWIISFAISTVSEILLFLTPEFQDIDNFMDFALLSEQPILDTLSNVYGLIFLVLVGSLAFDPRRQGVHDKVADTFCIKTR